MEGESRENFLLLLQQHVDRLRPADEVEFGMIEEMCASYWRQRRAWSLETGLFNKQMALQPDGGMMERMVVAFDTIAASPSLALIHRYETRLHLTYQRALRTLILLRTIDLPNEDPPEDDPPNDPSPIPEHSPPPCGAANPGCSRLSAGPRPPDAEAPTARDAPASPLPAEPAAPRPSDAEASTAGDAPASPANPSAGPRPPEAAASAAPPAATPRRRSPRAKAKETGVPT